MHTHTPWSTQMTRLVRWRRPTQTQGRTPTRAITNTKTNTDTVAQAVRQAYANDGDKCKAGLLMWAPPRLLRKRCRLARIEPELYVNG